MALIDAALLDTERVFVDTTTNPTGADLIGIGALNSSTVIYYGNGTVDLNTIVGVGAISNGNIVATGGADVTLGAGLLDVNLLTSQNLLIDGDSTITLQAGAVNILGAVTDLLNNTTVEFSGSGAGRFTFVPPTVGILSSFTIDIDKMGPGDQVVIPFDGRGNNYVLREPPGGGYNASTGYLTLTNGGGLNNVNVRIKMTPAEYAVYSANKGAYLDGAKDTFTFPGTPDPNEPPYVVPCFVRGTLIATDAGQVAVEDLTVGCLVQTRDHGLQPVRWIGSKKLSALDLINNKKMKPIRIKAGALGHGTPEIDLLVSPQHRVLVRSKIAQKMFGTDEVLVAAKQLLQIEGIDVAHDLPEVEYFHILFDQHEVVLSNGAETESLYTGKEALKAVGPAAREEIFSLFPELREDDEAATGARRLLSGREGRKLAVRHAQNGRHLVM